VVVRRVRKRRKVKQPVPAVQSGGSVQAGTTLLPIGLTAPGVHFLSRWGHLSMQLNVTYTPVLGTQRGTPRTAPLSLTLRTHRAHKRKHKRR
jgi:hypothetical protein